MSEDSLHQPGLGPVKVVTVDMDGLAPEISSQHPNGSRYSGALLIGFRNQRPIGKVEVPFSSPVLRPEEVAAALAVLPDKPMEDEPIEDEPIEDEPIEDESSGLPDHPLPRITVVVPSTLSRVTTLERCVASLLEQDYPDFDVIIVDNRPDPSPQRAVLWRRLSQDRRVRVIGESIPGISAARNRGAAESDSPVLAFTDDDVMVGPGWLRAIGSRFAREPETDCVTGLILPAEMESPAQVWFERLAGHMATSFAPLHFSGPGPRRLRGFHPARFTATARRADGTTTTFWAFRGDKIGAGANHAIRAGALREAGGYDIFLGTGTPAMGGEDQLLMIQLLLDGRRITFDPAAYVFHTHRETYDELREQMYGYNVCYTAMLVAAGRRADYLVGLMWYAVEFPRKVAHCVKVMIRSSGRDMKRLPAIEVRGLVAGPLAYVRSRRTIGKAVTAAGAVHMAPMKMDQ